MITMKLLALLCALPFAICFVEDEASVLDDSKQISKVFLPGFNDLIQQMIDQLNNQIKVASIEQDLWNFFKAFGDEMAKRDYGTTVKEMDVYNEVNWRPKEWDSWYTGINIKAVNFKFIDNDQSMVPTSGAKYDAQINNASPVEIVRDFQKDHTSEDSQTFTKESTIGTKIKIETKVKSPFTETNFGTEISVSATDIESHTNRVTHTFSISTTVPVPAMSTVCIDWEVVNKKGSARYQQTLEFTEFIMYYLNNRIIQSRRPSGGMLQRLKSYNMNFHSGWDISGNTLKFYASGTYDEMFGYSDVLTVRAYDLGTDCKNPGSSASIDVVPLTEVHKYDGKTTYSR